MQDFFTGLIKVLLQSSTSKGAVESLVSRGYYSLNWECLDLYKM